MLASPSSFSQSGGLEIGKLVELILEPGSGSYTVRRLESGYRFSFSLEFEVISRTTALAEFSSIFGLI